MRIRDVEEITGLGRALIYRLAHQGRFPRQVRMANQASGWIDEEVYAWIEERVKERDRALGGE